MIASQSAAVASASHSRTIASVGVGAAASASRGAGAHSSGSRVAAAHSAASQPAAAPSSTTERPRRSARSTIASCGGLGATAVARPLHSSPGGVRRRSSGASTSSSAGRKRGAGASSTARGLGIRVKSSSPPQSAIRFSFCWSYSPANRLACSGMTAVVLFPCLRG